MLTLRDCIEYCELNDGLGEDELEAIAEHERVTFAAAVGLGDYLVQLPEGVPMIERMILDGMAAAESRGDWGRALHLKLVLRHFVRTHRGTGLHERSAA